VRDRILAALAAHPEGLDSKQLTAAVQGKSNEVIESRVCLLTEGRITLERRPHGRKVYRLWCAPVETLRDIGADADVIAAAQKTAEARERRLASDHEALRPEDYAVGIANDGRTDPKASTEKRQEYSRSMGEFATRLEAGDLIDRDAAYITLLAEQERRFGNRRIARSVSLLAAHNALALRQFREAAREHLAGKIEPAGYALRPRASPPSRAIVLLLSDLHFGADLSGADNPTPFGAVEEARRFEHVIVEAVEYKKRHRDQSELVLLLNGDLIEGYLLHDLRSGAPLTEQKLIFWKHLSASIGLLSREFPRVRVYCQPGNHGRDVVRHPGRATSEKWDGHEWSMYWALKEMSRRLDNVTFDIPQRAISVVDLYGKKLLVTHGDTELKIGHPDRAAERNRQVLDRVNSALTYGVRFDGAAFGHWHAPRFQPGVVELLFNGALVPPNGFARSMGFTGEQCGQFVFESVPGHLIGDLRLIRVGPEQDRDTRLGSIIPPFRLGEAA